MSRSLVWVVSGLLLLFVVLGFFRLRSNAGSGLTSQHLEQTIAEDQAETSELVPANTDGPGRLVLDNKTDEKSAEEPTERGLSVRVQDLRGNPIHGAQVRVELKGGPSSEGPVIVVERGLTRLLHKPPLALHVSAQGFVERQVTVPEVATETVVVLEPLRRVTGRVNFLRLPERPDRLESGPVGSYARTPLVEQRTGEPFAGARVLLVPLGHQVDPKALDQALQQEDDTAIHPARLTITHADGAFAFDQVNPYQDHVLIAGGDGFVTLRSGNPLGAAGYVRGDDAHDQEYPLLAAPIYAFFVRLLGLGGEPVLGVGKTNGQIGCGSSRGVRTQAVMLDDTRFLMAGGTFECMEPASGQYLLAFTPLRQFAAERLSGAIVYANVPGYEPAQQFTDAPRLIGGCLSVDLELNPLVAQWEPVHIQFLGLRHDWLDTSEEGHGRRFQVLREGAEPWEASTTFHLSAGTDVTTLPSVPYVPGEGIALSQFFGSTRFPSEGWIELSRETLRAGGHHVVVDLTDCAALELRPIRKDGMPYTERMMFTLLPKDGPKSGPTVSMKGPVCKAYPLAPGAYTVKVRQPHVPESVHLDLKSGERKVVLIEVGER